MKTIRYQATLLPAELGWLRATLGGELRRVTTDGWAVEIDVGDRRLRIEPETVQTPDDERPVAGVARVRVVSAEPVTEDSRLEEVADDLGRIVRLDAHNTIVTFSAVDEVEPSELPVGGTLPAGLSYRAMFHRPHAFRAERVESAIVDLDLGLEIATDGGRRVVVHTDGTGPFLSVQIDDRPSPGWERRAAPIAQVRSTRIRAEESE